MKKKNKKNLVTVIKFDSLQRNYVTHYPLSKVYLI
jgi:hypothetical protein